MRAIDLKLLTCPNTRQPLILQNPTNEPWIQENILITPDKSYSYPIKQGIPQLLPATLPDSAISQQNHYTKIAKTYLEVRENLSCTIEYWKYLDNLLIQACNNIKPTAVLEICCGDGAFLKKHFLSASHRIGIDLSFDMLASNTANHEMTLLCGHATQLPLSNQQFDLVYLHGGVHHVPQRSQLFQEIFRVLRPKGKIVFLEPIDDFFLARWLRKLIYRYSSFLDNQFEQPLRWQPTKHLLKETGFTHLKINRCSYLAGGLFANTDVMGFMREYERIPYKKLITQSLIKMDDIWRHLPVINRMSLLAIIQATKP